MRKIRQATRIGALVLSVSLLLSGIGGAVSAQTTDAAEAKAAPTVAVDKTPANIQALIPDEWRHATVYLSSEAEPTEQSIRDNAELFTLRMEDPVTGEGTLQVYSTAIKYVDKKGKLQFVDKHRGAEPDMPGAQNLMPIPAVFS